MSRPNGSKLDLDALLKGWPAPAREESVWEERAEAIVRAALAAPKNAGADVSPALFEAPSLAAEPGEPPAPIVSAGEIRMSQDSDQSASSPKPESTPASAVTPSTAPPKSTERKRGSLKEIAARASQAGVASRPGVVVPSAPASRTGSSSLASPTATPLPSRPPEASAEDSGIVDLNVVKAKATSEEKAAAEKAQPATEGLLDDVGDEKADKGKVVPIAAAKAAGAPAKAAAAPAKAKKGSGGVIAGVVIAAVGLAAAFAIITRNQGSQTPAQSVAATDTKTTVGEQPNAQEAQKSADQAPLAAGDTTAQPSSGDPSGSTEAPSGGGEKAAAAPAGGNAGAQQPSGGGATPPAEEKQGEATADKPGTAPAAPATPSKPGDLKGAMAAAVGEDANKTNAPTADQAEPAAGSRSQSIPEQPPQGQVNASVRAVMPAVKACVAGADDVSRATVTFASNGSVKSVSVTGWAASHGATGCITAALKSANVGPFSKSSFTTGITIRP